MAIKGEVHVRNLLWHPAATFQQGRYVIQPFECKITGTAQGCARVKASIHTILASFEEEEWRIITLTVGHLDSQSKYTDLFAPSCGPIEDFTDIKKYDEGYVVPPKMRNFNFPVRTSTAPFMCKFIPLTRSIFAPRCIRPVHSCSPPTTLILHCCNICVSNSSTPKSLFSFFLTFRNIGLTMMAL